MRATEVLTQEHRAIGKVLDVLDKAADAIQAGEKVPPDMIRDSLDFITNFADKCHHMKEETRMFRMLNERGMPREQGPIAVMLKEHDLGRGFVKSAKDNLEAYERGETEAGSRLAEALKGYVGLLREHIMKEDNVLFPMADRVLSEADQQELNDEFEEIEENVIGPGKHEEYHNMIDRLEAEAVRL